MAKISADLVKQLRTMSSAPAAKCEAAWDEEHGLGVLTHKDRVIEIGQADAAFVGHSVKKDGGKLIKG